ncbi:McrC family protein [Rhodococcoides kroppenstedtii]|uniref:McrC family protein n=1 Tax=Rhodococcoides kroppenstedtii TaxID=293050 RepID=UPI001427E7F8|nr:hypothetical protein [Rhodococcus kroppenstedtii]NIL81085.1 hypothetical protein [Rhodococcus kroppenstedtii]
MRTISLVEGQGSRHRLDQAELAAVRAMQFVEIGLTSETGIYELQPAKNKVGALSSSGVQVLIHPKVAVSRLFWLMDFAEQDVPWANAKLGLEEASDLTSAIGHSFLEEATRSVEQIIRGYVPSEDTSQVLRGRLSISRQIKRHMGMPIPMEIEYDDFVANVTENRILLAAAVRCARMPSLSTRDRMVCRALIRRLESSGVRPSRPGEMWRATRLNQHYRMSLRLADMILKSESFAFESGGVRATGFIIDMWSVFEDFVVKWLRCYMDPRRVSMSSQHALAMDTDLQFKPRADLYLSTPGGGVFVDAKYKSIGQGQPPISDVYQVHSYCIAARSKVAHLVYVGSESSGFYALNNSNVTVHRHSIDLSADTAVLNAQLERIAGLIAEGLGVECSSGTHPATSLSDHRAAGQSNPV